MKCEFRLLFVLLLSVPIIGFSQQKDTLLNKLDSLDKRADSSGKQFNNISLTAYNESTKLTFNSYYTLLASDLKQVFTKPFHMTRKDWGNLGKFAVVIGAHPGLYNRERIGRRYKIYFRQNKAILL